MDDSSQENFIIYEILSFEYSVIFPPFKSYLLSYFILKYIYMCIYIQMYFRFPNKMR